MRPSLFAPTLSSRIALSMLLAAAALLLPGCGRKESGGGTAAKHSGFPGYTLVQQLASRTTELIDMDGRPVHRWPSQNGLGGGTYLLEDGRLLRSSIPSGASRRSPTPGLSGMIEMLDWDGKVLWSYTQNEEDNCLHHDIEVMPNGNILMLVMEEVSAEEQIALGRDPARATKKLQLDYLIEVKPTGSNGGEIVWKWHLKDHLIQDFDKTKKNYGAVSENPGRVDVNYIEALHKANTSSLRQMQSLGYVGSTANIPSAARSIPDWTHANSVAYHAGHDQILMSVRSLGEIWIIDRGTTTEEAASSKGGKRGKGGDLLYRWGNPQAFQCGAPGEQQLFGQHDAQWIPEGRPGAGNILIYNNGEGRKEGGYSSIEEITPPVKADGSYEHVAGEAFGPEKPAWRYVAEKPEDFYSSFLSGVQRLPNGHTLICSGVQGRIFEVTPDGEIAWEHKKEVAPQTPGGGPGMGKGKGKGPMGARRPGMPGAKAAGKGPLAGRQGMGPGAAKAPDAAGGAAPAGEPPELPPVPPAEGDSRFNLAEIAFLMGPDAPLAIPPPMPMPPPMPGDSGGPPGMGPPGAGGPGMGPGGGGPGAGGGGLFRAVRYAEDYPAFKDRKLVPLTPVMAGK